MFSLKSFVLEEETSLAISSKIKPCCTKVMVHLEQ